MKCKFKECGELPLALSEFCWDHLPDREGYIARLQEALNSGKGLTGANLKKADLSKTDFNRTHLFDCNLNGAELVGAKFSGCDLAHCSLDGADLTKADLSNARLWNASLISANLTECDLSGADLWNAKMFNVKLWHVDLADTKSINMMNFSRGAGRFNNPKVDESGALSAEESYRDLKRYFLNNGMYNDASWASFKEKTMERLILKRGASPNYLPSLLMNILCGYGEKPYRIVLSALLTVLSFAGVYHSFNAVERAGAPDYLLRWSDYIYYSTITFTTVGYGDFIPRANAFFRSLAASESFIGVFLTGLFIFTLARKYSAR